MAPISLTAFPPTKTSLGNRNDFYSNADYWWPNPNKPDGFARCASYDGAVEPPDIQLAPIGNARPARRGRPRWERPTRSPARSRYARKAVRSLRGFFIDEKTRMNPNLNFAQVVPGQGEGRPAGIIDGLHLIEIPLAIAAMERSPSFSPELLAGLKKWFGDMAHWMVTSGNGKKEGASKNNHAVAFWLQVACFARFAGDEKLLAECRRQFKEVFVSKQMAADGSFPAELKRTKPYAYSIFQLDNMAALCQVLSTPEDDLWRFELPDGRGMRKAMAYLYPYLADKAKWPRKPDVQACGRAGQAAAAGSLLFAGLAYRQGPYLELWKKLPPDPSDAEVRRNMAITQPVLWVK